MGQAQQVCALLGQDLGEAAEEVALAL